MAPEATMEEDVASMGVKELKGVIAAAGLDFADCREKVELQTRAAEAMVLGPKRGSVANVRRDIARALRDRNHDDGSYAPLLIRFAWHCCGTYDAATGTGGSNGSTMRFAAERGDGENAGLDKAVAVLHKIHAKHPWMSIADLYVLGGYVAIEATGGPAIPFATGRRDYTETEAEKKYGPSRCPFGDGQHNPSGSRLPAADLGPDMDAPPGAPDSVREAKTIAAIRGTFTRMGFSDKETVCLIVLGHQYGRCHPDVSGFEGSWYGFGPTEWNVYAHGLGYLTIYQMLDRFQEVKTRKGKRQWNNSMFGGDGTDFMMLPVDMALSWDPEYRNHIEYYDRRRLEFRRDAARAWKKLTELGCEGLLTPEENAPELE